MACSVAILIWGLVLARSIAEYMTVSILMTYLVIVGAQPLFMAAITVNIFDPFSSLLPLVAAYAADAYIDRFNVIVFSTASYVMGLILLLATLCSDSEYGLVNVAILLVALGKSGGGSVLQSFLEYQVRQGKRYQTAICSIAKRRHQSQRGVDDTNIWWHSARIYGYVVVPAMVLGLFSVENGVFPVYYYSFQISAMWMVFASLPFFYGNRFYHYESPTKTVSLPRVFKLLKAASSNNLLLWASFLSYAVVLATASTLFTAQINFDDEYDSINFMPFTPFFFILKSLTSDMVSFLFWWRDSSRKRVVTAIRIGAGMICSVITCVVARHVGLYIMDSSMNGSWFIPQFFFLGVMEGLVGGGLVTHINDHLHESIIKGDAPESMRSFGEPLSELVVCVGKFSSIVFMSLCNFWFRESINDSKVDRYFLVVAVLCSLSFCFYLLWWRNFSDGSACKNVETNQAGELEEEIVMGNVQEDADRSRDLGRE